MRTNKVLILLATVVMGLLVAQGVAADSAPAASSGQQWNVQVEKVDTGEVNIDPAFQVAIYENILAELQKTKKFEQVYRSGDRRAGTEDELLILKIKVQKFDAGSETKRAVTTVAGATKIKVESSLQTRSGQVVKEDVVNAAVRFFGNNMRVTHNLARNIAKDVKKSTLPEASTTVSASAGA